MAAALPLLLAELHLYADTNTIASAAHLCGSQLCVSVKLTKASSTASYRGLLIFVFLLESLNLAPCSAALTATALADANPFFQNTRQSTQPSAGCNDTAGALVSPPA
jgi:bacteriorhodopsin